MAALLLLEGRSAKRYMESMRDVDRVMEREIKKGSTPLQFEQLGFGDYSYNEITSKEKLLQVLSYLLRIGEYEPFAGKTIGNNVYMDMRGKKAVFKRTRLTYERNNIFATIKRLAKKYKPDYEGKVYIDYEDNLLENGLDSLLLSQISGRIVSDIQEAQGMRFDEILRASLTMPTIMGIAQYISDCKNPSKNQMHSNAGNQTRNSYTVVYIFGDNENEIRDVLIEKLSASNISCKRVGGQEIIERCHEDISVKKKYIIAFSEMASLCITKASELLGENIIINRIFLINPSKAKESDLYLGDISIIDGNSVAIKSWEKAVLGNVREFESNSNDIFDIIMRELENDK